MPHSPFRRTRQLALVLALATTTPAFAQDSVLDQWGIDAGALVADGRDLVLRAPDASVDGLFQAVHASAQSPQDARVLCTLFDPQAERSLEGYNEIASQLGEQSRVRFANAVADFVVASAQNPPQPYNPALAMQALKAAGVRAALLNDGFVAGLSGDNHDARCRSVSALLDALQARPVKERASVMRLLLSQGLDYLAFASAPAVR